MAVSGQIDASTQKASVAKVLTEHGVPTRADHGKHVFKKTPGSVKLLGEGTEAVPVKEKGQVLLINLSRAQRPWIIAKKETGVSIETSESEPYAGGMQLVDEKEWLVKRHIFLQDKNGKKVAVCVAESGLNVPILSKPTFFIFSYAPCLEGEDSVTVEGIEEPLYKYAEVVTDAKDVLYKMRLFNGTGYEPAYNAHVKYMQSRTHQGVIVRLAADEKKSVATLQRKPLYTNDAKDTGWEMTIAPGIDPLQMTLFAAILDHIMSRSY